MSIRDNMKQPKQSLEEVELLRLIKAGRLFDLQAWIQSDRKLPISPGREAFCPLSKAVDTGFHSLVEVLLKAGGWSQYRLDHALQLAIANSRLDVADLLQNHGAAPSAIDFETICRTAKPEIMERYLRAGADPSFDNAFARALCEMKARPLLRFYRSLKDEFPALQAQAALALTEAVCQKSVQWVALLAWAGADPFMKVPQDLRGGWDNIEEDYSRTAAQEACWSGNDMLVKVLKLKPTPAQALDLLRDAACAHHQWRIWCWSRGSCLRLTRSPQPLLVPT